ncbi:ribonuclease H1 [Sarcoptes scabiei]|nr:ribonuclease H1 [Sarcoptes scabiei]
MVTISTEENYESSQKDVSKASPSPPPPSSSSSSIVNQSKVIQSQPQSSKSNQSFWLKVKTKMNSSSLTPSCPRSISPDARKSPETVSNNDRRRVQSISFVIGSETENGSQSSLTTLNSPPSVNSQQNSRIPNVKVQFSKDSADSLISERNNLERNIVVKDKAEFLDKMIDLFNGSNGLNQSRSLIEPSMELNNNFEMKLAQNRGHNENHLVNSNNNNNNHHHHHHHHHQNQNEPNDYIQSSNVNYKNANLINNNTEFNHHHNGYGVNVTQQINRINSNPLKTSPSSVSFGQSNNHYSYNNSSSSNNNNNNNNYNLNSNHHMLSQPYHFYAYHHYQHNLYNHNQHHHQLQNLNQHQFDTIGAGNHHLGDEIDPNLDPIDGIVALLSTIYCKILVVIGLCFPIAEVISHRIPISWYEGFYLYLYMGSILFLIFVYIFLLNRKRKPFEKFRRLLSKSIVWKKKSSIRSKPHDSQDINGVENPDERKSELNQRQQQWEKTDNSIDEEHYEFDPTQQPQCGSFYLRVGAVAFGVGSMIYSGLEFGQFFEIESKEHCYSFIYGFTPSSHMIFTFIQLYFIFMNSRVLIARHKLIARFGLMHMIATNICVWLHVLIQETKHQIMVMVQLNSTNEMIGVDLTQAWDHVDDVVEEMSEDYLDSVGSYPVVHRTKISPTKFFNTNNHSNHENLSNIDVHGLSTLLVPTATNKLHRAIRSLNDHYITHGHCRRSNVIGELVTDASQFLFPCTIEYSLICAAILYIMWKNISQINDHNRINISSKVAQCNRMTTFGHHKHHYQVDCAKAHKGLFTGIFLMVMCIISLILFFVFIKKHQYRNLAVLQAHIVELIIYCITAIASLIALFQVRELNYNRNRGVELDNILLIIAQSGLCIFTMFSIIGAQFINQQQNTRLVLINAFACLIQALLQSIFILDASKRKAITIDQVRRKPGREMVTFLLVCNFSMWAINTLETRRADSNPVQMSFYGFWAWTIITHVTTPLTIFYRFHSTVSLCEIWKSTYKIKSEFM